MTTQTLHGARDDQWAQGTRLTRRPAATALVAVAGSLGGALGAALIGRNQ